MREINKVYTLEEISDLLHVTRRTLYTYIKEGKLKAVKIGKYWRVRDDQIEAFLSTDTGKQCMEPEYTLEELTQKSDLEIAMDRLSSEEASYVLWSITFDERPAAEIAKDLKADGKFTPEGQNNIMAVLKMLDSEGKKRKSKRSKS